MRASRILVLSLLALMLLAACSDNSAVEQQQPGVGVAFAQKAVAVCRAAVTRKDAQGPFPYPDFNPTDPDASKLPDIARFLTGSVEIYTTWLDQMKALGQPPSAQAAWNALLAAIERHVKLNVEQQAAAEHGDTKTFTKDYREGLQARTDLTRAAGAAGVPECAAVDR